MGVPADVVAATQPSKYLDGEKGNHNRRLTLTEVAELSECRRAPAHNTEDKFRKRYLILFNLALLATGSKAAIIIVFFLDRFRDGRLRLAVRAWRVANTLESQHHSC